MRGGTPGGPPRRGGGLMNMGGAPRGGPEIRIKT